MSDTQKLLAACVEYRAKLDELERENAALRKARDAVVLEFRKVDAENAALRRKVEHQGERIRYLEGATNHATGTPLSKAQAELAALREDKARLESYIAKHMHDLEAENTGQAIQIEKLQRENAALRDALVQAGITEKRLKEHADRVNNANDRLIVEILPLYEDKARLDWLAVSDAWFDTPADEAFTPQSFRAAIDALRKEAQP